MKSLTLAKRLITRSALALALTVTYTVQADIVHLTSDNSDAWVDLGSDRGMYAWNIHGVPQLNQQWFWYRLGNGAEQSIDKIGPVTYSFLNGPFDATLSATYSNLANNFAVRIDYTLTGGTSADNTSSIAETITIFNAGSSSLNFHFFQYSDFNLAGSAANDNVKISLTSTGIKATQWKGPNQVSETIDQPLASFIEAGLRTDSPNTLTKLNDGAATVLNNQDTAGPGDATWALQWDFVIGAGTQQDVFKNKRLSVEPIPEPATAALLGLALLGFALRRRSA